jgi:hypothetical protein
MIAGHISLYTFESVGGCRYPPIWCFHGSMHHGKEDPTMLVPALATHSAAHPTIDLAEEEAGCACRRRTSSFVLASWATFSQDRPNLAREERRKMRSHRALIQRTRSRLTPKRRERERGSSPWVTPSGHIHMRREWRGDFSESYKVVVYNALKPSTTGNYVSVFVLKTTSSPWNKIAISSGGTEESPWENGGAKICRGATSALFELQSYFFSFPRVFFF